MNDSKWKSGKRICSKCEEYLNPDCFGKNKASSDGLKAQCKSCRKESEREYRKNNPEAKWVVGNYGKPHNTDHRYNKDGNRYCQDCKKHVSPSLFSKSKDYQDGLSKRCKPCTSERDYLYRQKYADKIRLQKRNDYLINKVKILDRNRNRHYLTKANHNGESVDFESIRKRDGMMCYLCGNKIIDDLHFDHIDPLSRGGSHTEDNIACTHKICNLRKHNKTLLEFLLYDSKKPTWFTSISGGSLR